MFNPNGFNFDKLLSHLYLYTGVFFDDNARNKLLEICPPIHPNVYADHVTLRFRPTPEEVMELDHWTDDNGEELTVYLMHMFSDEKVQVAAVSAFGIGGSDFPKNPQQVLHITISCAEGISPSYSNKLLSVDPKSDPNIEKRIWGVTPSVKGTLGVCAQTDRNYLPSEVLKRRGLITR